jgi:hypothetical protein
MPEATTSEWITQYSFLARLTRMGVVRWWRHTLWAMEDALEVERRPLSCDVLAAVEIIARAGNEFFHACRNESDDGLSLARWEHWAVRFGEVARLFDGVVSTAAALAELEMVRLLGNNTRLEIRVAMDMGSQELVVDD